MTLTEIPIRIVFRQFGTLQVVHVDGQRGTLITGIKHVLPWATKWTTMTQAIEVFQTCFAIELTDCLRYPAVSDCESRMNTV